MNFNLSKRCKTLHRKGKINRGSISHGRTVRNPLTLMWPNIPRVIPSRKSQLRHIIYCTCTVTRMINSEVSSQIAHFSLEHTHVVVGCSIRRTYGIFKRWTNIVTNTSCFLGPKRLANSKVVTGNVDTRIEICKTKFAKYVSCLGYPNMEEQKSHFFTFGFSNQH